MGLQPQRHTEQTVDQYLAAPPVKRPITKRQAEMLQVIIDHKRTYDGCSPSVRQLSGYLSLATTSATYALLRSLVAAGRITMQLGETRSIQVVGAHWTAPLDAAL